MSIRQEFDFLIQWHLTERCNLSCRHCYQSGGRGAELSLGEVRDVIAEISDMLAEWHNRCDLNLTPSFNLTGGEPFLRPDFFTILEELAHFSDNLFVLTNGTVVDDSIAKRLAELGIRGVQVSLEGPEEINDSIRGKGSFSAAMKGVGHLLAAGLRVTLNATLSRRNLHAVPSLVQIASAAGVQRFGLARLVPYGRGEEMLADMPTTAEVQTVYEQLFSIAIPGLEIVTGDPVAGQMSLPVTDGGSIPGGGCAAGVSGLTILSDGTLVPCRRLPIPLGNVRKDSLREVWATSPILSRLREKRLYGGKCGECPRWAGCRGCRGVAFAWSTAHGENDFLAEDPQCFAVTGAGI